MMPTSSIRSSRHGSWLLSLGLVALALGCTNSGSAPAKLSEEQIHQLRQQLLLADQPADARGVIEVRDQLTGEADAESSVTVVGQVGGMPNPYGNELQPVFPWVENEAAFFLADPTTAAQFVGHQHDADEQCPYCERKARELVDTVALVRLVDDQGQPLPVRADRLLKLEPGATVVVTGTARRDLGMLTIQATGVYVEPEEDSQADVNAEGDGGEPAESGGEDMDAGTDN